MKTGLASCALAALASCASFTPADNIENVDAGQAYQAQYRSPTPMAQGTKTLKSDLINAQNCIPWRGGAPGAGKGVGVTPSALLGEILSRDDLLELNIPDDEVFSGAYVVSRDGKLKVPFIGAIPAQGRSPEAVANDIARALVAGDYYQDAPRISLLVSDFAPARVAVSGAVFEPGPRDIGGVPGDQVDALRQAARGSSTEGRNLSVALRASGGVRPDADLSAVELYRNGRKYVLDLRPVIDGRAFEDVMLMTGDEVVVHSRQCFQSDLMVPSPISPPGVSLFMSNVTQPADSNAQSAIGREVREVPYGTRMMQAVVDLNCVGGVRATSADRSAALFSRNPVTDVSVVVQRRIEEMRVRADRDDFDPYLLPGDALACYDSGVTNIADVGRVLGLVALGVALAK
ncbi:polysaccharide biosynthesis/export family protein [Halovulum sp. GXIMD14794]